MKRRDPQAERQRWGTFELFRAHRRRARDRTLMSALVAGALGFGMVLAIAVLSYFPAVTYAERWPVPLMQELRR
jgi:hypothetical protein